LIKLLGKAAKVVDRARRGHRGQRHRVDIPMGRDREDRFGPRQGFRQLHPGFSVAIIGDGIHRIPMPQKYRRHMFMHREYYNNLSGVVRFLRNSVRGYAYR